MSKIYGCAGTQEFIDKMVEQDGYEAVQLDEGVLGIGEWVLLSHNERKYNFHIKEKYINCWSSGQTIRRMAKISESLRSRIDDAGTCLVEEW